MRTVDVLGRTTTTEVIAVTVEVTPGEHVMRWVPLKFRATFAP
jgi:hypothetical protein